MASFVRESKFRHSAVTLTKREQHYENLKTYQCQNDINGVAGNSTFFAYIDTTGTGSALAVLPLTSVGKNHVPISSPAYQQPIIRAHGQSIQDFDFNPFHKHQIYSCSTDKTIKLWQIPEDGLTVDMSVPALCMSFEDSSPVRGIAPHSTANNLVAARGSRCLALFDVEAGRSVCTVPAAQSPTADFQSMSWSFHGDVLVTTAKDKLLRLLDFRSVSAGSAASSATAHVGLRFSRTVWLGDSQYVLSCGHNNAQEREFMVWDARNLSGGPVKRERVDSSYGPLIPIFDADHNTLVLMGKGDSSLRIYDVDFITTGANSSATGTGNATTGVVTSPISNNSVSSGSVDVIKGACLLPKQCNDMMSCEVMRILKLTDGAVQPVSITVPRKEKLKFHEDLYPPTVCEASAALTSAEWLAGGNSALTRVILTLKAGASNNSSSAPTTPVADRSNTGSASPVPVEEDEAAESSSSSSRAFSKRFSSLTSTSKFRHMYGTESTKDFSFFNLMPDLSAMDSPIVACSDTYFAIPHRAGGGPVYVSQLNAFGKVNPDCSVINGHKAPVQDISFSPFHSGLMATGSNDSTVRMVPILIFFHVEGTI